MIPFLQAVAEAYASRYADLSDFCFVFPNKRSGTFFLKELRDRSGSPALAPCVTSIAALAESLSGRMADSRIDLLFRLYKAYCRFTNHSTDDSSDGYLDFDSFRSWGETVISDFSEIDMYCLDPEVIFKNLRDFRRISANYLTEGQRKVLEEYFGYTVSPQEAEETFWRTFEPIEVLREKMAQLASMDSKEREEAENAKIRFLQLWEVLAELYAELENDLASNGLATSGGTYRLALQRLADDSKPLRLPWGKMVFVGFNALSLAERELMRTLAERRPGFRGPEGEEPYADFFWDGTGAVLGPRRGNDKDAPEAGAAHFINLNRRDFPSPEWAAPFLAKSDAPGIPERLTVIAAPSNSIQAKVAGDEVYRMRKEVRARLAEEASRERGVQVDDRDPEVRAAAERYFREAKVAVVLPDENLLLPLVYSIPDDMESVNLTMGYPLKMTSAASFAWLFRNLQGSVRNVKGLPCFQSRPLRKVLGHPYVASAIGTKGLADINRHLDQTHHRQLPLQELESVCPEAARLLVPVPETASVEEAAANLSRTLLMLADSLGRAGGPAVVKEKIDRKYLQIYQESLRRLVDAIDEHGIKMKPHTFFLLADRLLGGELVAFEGEPLQGLQIMGMLETRALDFERVVILSANDSQLPKRGRTRSFIPNTLRAAYRMPPMQHQENLAAYYFYRLISRAREVVMVYDSRTAAGTKSSDVSRYVLQLKHLYAKGHVRFEEKRFRIQPNRHRIDEMRKTPFAIDRLKLYTKPEKGKSLSATSLKKYCACGLAFFYEHVAGMKSDSEPSDYIDAREQGDIVHQVLMELLVPADRRHRLLEHPVVVTRKQLKEMIANTPMLDRMLHRAINQLHYHLPPESLDTPLPGSAQLLLPPMRRWVENVLRKDLQFAPLQIYGVEIEQDERFPLRDGREVNFRFIIDRLDVPGGPYGMGRCGEGRDSSAVAPSEGGATSCFPRAWRMVDYKTGNHISMDLDSVSEFIRGSKKEPLQLLLYSELLTRHVEREEPQGDAPDVKAVIYHVPRILKPADNNNSPGVADIRVLANPVPVAEGGEGTLEAWNVDSYREIRGKVQTALTAKLEELLSDDEPFRAAEDPSNCRFCSFRMLCGRL